jgi:hypothetical protein
VVRVQLLVDESSAVLRLCILAGPTFRDLLAALRVLNSTAYTAPHYWRVDASGMAWLHVAVMRVEDGILEPVLRELAHRATIGLAHDWLPLWQPPAYDGS